MHPGDVISYLEMCATEGMSLQRGMNFGVNGRASIILMSRRSGAPYADRIEDEGQTLIYEGHDVPTSHRVPTPKLVDQVATGPNGRPTQNGLFFAHALKYKNGDAPAERVRVYEKIKSGIWVFNGVFELIDAWQEQCNGRKVFKFKLVLAQGFTYTSHGPSNETPLAHPRLIPTQVKIEVWKRDKGRCVICSSNINLHFDHVIPYSMGGSSLVPENVQLMCAKHNIEKGATLA